MSSTVNLTVPFFISSDALSASLISPAFTFSDSGLTVHKKFAKIPPKSFVKFIIKYLFYIL